MKKTISKYGLMHVSSGKMVGFITSVNHGEDCVDVQYVLDEDEENRLWLVDDPEHAEYVRLHSTEWYNAEHDTPTHKFDSKELKVVKYTVIVEIEDVEVSIPTFPEYIKQRYHDQPKHRDYVLSEWDKASKRDRQRAWRYSLYDLRILRDKQKGN